MVSIIMPVYNREVLIKRAIESVFRQTYQNWKLIVVDDNSSDHTHEVVEKYIKKDKRIQYIKLNENKGPSHARNIGIMASESKYIAFLDSDDEWTEEHLEECVSVLEEGEYKICSALWVEESNGNYQYVKDYDWFQESIEYLTEHKVCDDTQKYWRFGKNSFENISKSFIYCYHINTIVMNREIVDDVGVFDEKLGSSEDLEYFNRIFQKYPLVTVNRTHFIYHFGENNIYAFTNRKEIDFHEYLKDLNLRKKHIRNQVFKLRVFRKICVLIATADNFSDKGPIIKSIKEDMFYRCLTIALMNRGVSFLSYIRYYVKALSFCRTRQMIKMWMHYKKEEEIQIYFKMD